MHQPPPVKGKRQQPEYNYQLDLKEETAQLTEEQKAEDQATKKRKEDLFHLNMVDFSLFKLQSCVYII